MAKEHIKDISITSPLSRPADGSWLAHPADDPTEEFVDEAFVDDAAFFLSPPPGKDVSESNAHVMDIIREAMTSHGCIVT